MKNEPLQQSELLANHFAPYRAEAPLISAPEIEKLLAGSATADHPPTPSFFRRWNVTNIRRIIMTLSGLAGLAAISYFAFFNTGQGNNVSNRTRTTYASRGAQPQSLIATPTTPEAPTPLQKATKLLRKTDNPHGPWSAGNDQFYADLSHEELAKLGIVVEGDTVIAYKLPANDTLEDMQLTAHSIGGGNTKATLPSGVNPPRFYPVLMTHNNGHGTAFVIEEKGQTREWGMVADDAGEKMVRDWLQSPGTPGYSPIWFKTTSFTISDTIQINKWTLEVGKDFAKSPLPFCVPNIDGFSDSTKAALMQLANYYCGKAEKPNFTLPKNLFLKADTVTPQNMLDEIDSSENDGTMKHLHSTMARLNELVPVIVRPKGGSGAPDSNDYIFWYEPSDELFDALPQAQASIIRTKLNAPPHCISMPNEVLKIAEITYCVAEPQEVQVTVQDLTGKWLMIMNQLASVGDNVLRFPTETLPTGMYIVTVRDHDSTTRSQRLWVENAHPIRTKDENWKGNSPHSPDQLLFINNDSATPSNNAKTPMNTPLSQLHVNNETTSCGT